jgi:MFS family permease
MTRSMTSARGTFAREPAFSLGAGVALSVLTMAAGAFAVVGASANAPLIRAGLGLSEAGVGAIAGVAYLGAMLTSRRGGRATDSNGPTIVIFTGMVAIAAGVIVAATAAWGFVFYLGVLLAGLGYGVINPATNVLANPDTPRRRGLVMSMKQAGVPLGGIVAGVVLPAMGTAYGWRWAFLAPLAVCVAVAALAHPWRGAGRRDRPGSRAQAQDAAPATASGHAGPGVRLRLPRGYGYGFAMAGAQVSIFAFVTVYLVESRGVAPRVAGLGISLMLLAAVVARPIWGWVSDLYPARRLTVLFAAALLGTGAISTLWTVPVTVLPVALTAIGLCSVAWNGVYVAAVAEAGPPDEVGGNTGASLRMINLGGLICPVAIGLIVQVTGSWPAGWLACSALNMLGLVILVTGGAGRAQ